jgi:hypothetical protein
VLLGDQLRALGLAQDALKEQPSDIRLQQPIAIVRDARGAERRAIDLQVEKEAKEHAAPRRPAS